MDDPKTMLPTRAATGTGGIKRDPGAKEGTAGGERGRWQKEGR